MVNSGYIFLLKNYHVTFFCFGQCLVDFFPNVCVNEVCQQNPAVHIFFSLSPLL